MYKNLTFKVNFLCQKWWEYFQQFFPFHDIILNRAYFLFLTFFDKFNFQVNLFSEMMLNFWPPATISSQNTIISFWNIDFWPKIYLILYPSLENSKTYITITNIQKLSLSHLNVTDDNVKTLVQRCDKLTELDLQNTSITGQAVTYIIENLSQTLTRILLPDQIDIGIVLQLGSMPKLKYLWY